MSTRKLRVEYNNKWPEVFNFPIEEKFISLLQKKEINKVFIPATLNNSDEYKFQFYLGYLLDALDMLPMRPDLAFEHIWKALDAEFFIVQSELVNSNGSRFDAFVDKILNNPNTAASFLNYLNIIPHQTCEYAAKRIIEASVNNDNHSRTLFDRAKKSLGDDFISKFVAKYPPTSNGKPTPSDQRNAGRLLKLIFLGNQIELQGTNFLIPKEKLAIFLVKVILTNSRNEKFHGDVFPPFRSSSAKIETYAHAYYLFHISYALLLDIFLYREYGVIDLESVENIMVNNAVIFNLVFGDL